MNNISITNGEAIEELGKMPTESVDLIIADPPYNLGKDYGKSSDLKSKEAYLQFSRNWLSEAKRVLKSNGTIYIFMGVRFISYLYLIIEEELKMNFNSWICWHYTQGIGKTNGFSPRHDDILMFSKGKKPFFDLDAVRVPQKFYRKKITCEVQIPVMFGNSPTYIIPIRIEIRI